MLIGLGVAAVVVVWLVFSVFKRVLGLALLVAMAFGAWVVWSNPELQRSLIAFAVQFLGAR